MIHRKIHEVQNTEVSAVNHSAACSLVFSSLLLVVKWLDKVSLTPRLILLAVFSELQGPGSKFVFRVQSLARFARVSSG